MELADTITAEEVNALAKSLLSFASHYRSEAEVRARPGSSLLTTICFYCCSLSKPISK